MRERDCKTSSPVLLMSSIKLDQKLDTRVIVE